MLRTIVKKIAKSVASNYKRLGYPLLSITKFIREPMRFFYHQSPLLRHDSKLYLKPFLLKSLHALLVVDHPQDFKIYGEKISFRSYGGLMSVQGYYVGEIEYHLVQYLVNQLKPGFVMFDVGAHHGLYTLIVAYELKTRGWEGVIHSFEPNPFNFSLLKYNIEQNELSQYVVLHNEGVADYEGRQKLMVAREENSDGRLSSICDTEIDNNRYEPTELEIKVTKLDNFFSQLEYVNLIKMDIQGAEPLALAGSEKIIIRDRPTLLIEAVKDWSSTKQIQEFLISHNYSISGVNAKGELCQTESSEVFVSWDWVALAR